jgi:hypothetical protein
MLDNFEKYYTYDYPVPIGELYLYPVTMKDYICFHENIGCLLFNKNRIPDAQIISMSYLAFVYFISMQNGEYLKMLENLLYMCFRLDREKYEIDFNADKKGKPCININEYEIKKNEQNEFFKIKKINSWQFSHKDFKQIREIICEQNLVELPNEKIDPKLEAILLETQVFMNRKNNNLKIISLEDQMISVLINTALDWNHVLALSIRKFVKILERKNKELHYTIYKTASMSGMVEFKQDITHYLYDDQKDKYADLVTNYDEYMQKVNQVTDTNKGGK